MKYSIRSDQTYTVTLCENDTVKSILQNLSLLFATRKGTIPMYRSFGLSQSFLDRPQEVAQAMLLSEITDAVMTFEPRAKVIDAYIESSGKIGKAVIIVEVEI